MPVKKKSHLGVGLYSLADAARIVGAPTSTLSRWSSASRGIVPRFLDASEHTITFVELMELLFIKMFRDEGVSMQAIRKTSQEAAKKFKTDYPFAVQRFDTDGKTIFATLLSEATGKKLVEDLKYGQFVFEKILKPFFRKLDYGSFEVERYWPLEKGGRVVLDPARKFGQPIDFDSGIPTRTLYLAVSAGGGQEVKSVANWFGVPVAAVNAAVAFEQSIQQSAAAA
jgi:hypothetical protein